MRFDPYLRLYTQKLNSEWTKDVNLSPKTVQFPEEKRENLFDIAFGSIVLFASAYFCPFFILHQMHRK